MFAPRPLEFWLGLWTLLLFGAAAALAYYGPTFARRTTASPAGLTLRATDERGRFRVDWDSAAPAIRRADSAVLEVDDGGSFTKYPVDAKILRSGGLDYIRKSTDVLLTLTLLRGGKALEQAAVRSVGPPPITTLSAPFSRPAPTPKRSQTRSRRR